MAHAQLILKSGKITTLNKRQPEVQALAIADGKIFVIEQAPDGFAHDAKIIDAQHIPTSFALADLAVRLTETASTQDYVMQ